MQMGPNIDFATIHMWPDNWKDLDADFISKWLTSHMEVAKQMGKPLILEEVHINASRPLRPFPATPGHLLVLQPTEQAQACHTASCRSLLPTCAPAMWQVLKTAG